VFSDLEHKLRRMTILVGMIGSDGIILAADQARVRPVANETQMDDKMLGRKITHFEKHRVAYAVAGDDITDLFGDVLLESLNAGSLDFGGQMEQSLRVMVEKKIVQFQQAMQNLGGEVERTLLVVFYGPQVSEQQLWRLRIRAGPAASRIAGSTIAGAIGNSARFFDSYYKPNLPVRTLLPLASHIVLTGHRIDSLMVEGLDIATFDSNGFRFFTEEEKAPLRDRPNKLDAMTRRHLRLPEP